MLAPTDCAIGPVSVSRALGCNEGSVIEAVRYVERRFRAWAAEMGEVEWWWVGGWGWNDAIIWVVLEGGSWCEIVETRGFSAPE